MTAQHLSSQEVPRETLAMDLAESIKTQRDALLDSMRELSTALSDCRSPGTYFFNDNTIEIIGQIRRTAEVFTDLKACEA